MTLHECTCDEGWVGACCELPNGHDEGSFSLRRIRNDEVEQELSYATPQSHPNLPPILHGIFWMDQRGVATPISSDPDYKQSGSAAADEILVTFGEAEWDPTKRCAGRVPVFGGKKGHWTYMDQGEGTSNIFSSTLSSRLNLNFCFRDHTMTRIDIESYFKAGNMLEGILGFNLPESIDGYFALPAWIMHLSMEKKSFGWDRVTKILDLTKCRALMALLPDYLVTLISSAISSEAHYPVFQIVNGQGERTKYYDSYLRWVNDPESWPAFNATACAVAGGGLTGFDPSTFFCPQNHGNGTQLVGVLDP